MDLLCRRTCVEAGIILGPPPVWREWSGFRPDLIERVAIKQASVLYDPIYGLGVPNIFERMMMSCSKQIYYVIPKLNKKIIYLFISGRDSSLDKMGHFLFLLQSFLLIFDLLKSVLITLIETN